MHKDSFFYILKDRLHYANDYAKDCSDWLRSVEFQYKVDKEFHKNKIVLPLLLKLINLPTSIIRYCRYLRGTYNYYRALKEVEVLKVELKKYDQGNKNV
tara:strand:+ start:333 stop:629 length:297 start_codon:yes stop_codon:yes gene_type:complete